MLGVSNQVTKLLQGYVDNEVNLNPTNDCKKTCPDYTLTKNYQCYNGSLCDPAREDPYIRKCSGNVVNCQFFEGDMKICPSIVDRSRNYNYITLSSGATLGKAGPCEAEEAEVGLHSVSVQRFDSKIFSRQNHGPDGLYNVRIAFAIVTKKAKIRTDISVCNLCCQTPNETCKKIIAL